MVRPGLLLGHFPQTIVPHLGHVIPGETTCLVAHVQEVTQDHIAMAAAWPTLTLRVDPYWVMW